MRTIYLVVVESYPAKAQEGERLVRPVRTNGYSRWGDVEKHHMHFCSLYFISHVGQEGDWVSTEAHFVYLAADDRCTWLLSEPHGQVPLFYLGATFFCWPLLPSLSRPLPFALYIAALFFSGSAFSA